MPTVVNINYENRDFLNLPIFLNKSEINFPNLMIYFPVKRESLDLSVNISNLEKQQCLLKLPARGSFI